MTERSLSPLHQLSIICATIARELDVGRICARLVEGAVALTRGDEASCFLMDQEREAVFMRAKIFRGEEEAHQMVEEVARGSSFSILESGGAVTTSGDAPRGANLGSAPTMSTIPLVIGDEKLGLLRVVGADAHDPLSADDHFILARLAEHAAIAINNARLLEEAKTKALTDWTTGLPNRRGLDMLLEAEMAGARRYEHPLSILMVDIDDFKIFNDMAGHLAGDKQLKSISRVLTMGMRNADFVARFGGDEFILVAPHTDEPGAMQLAERIRSSARDLAPLETVGSKGIPGYTVSIGVATWHDVEKSMHELLRDADEALKLAKSRGKDQVCFLTMHSTADPQELNRMESNLSSNE